MGNFSWITQDTGNAIYACYSEYFDGMVVYMIDDKGKQWREKKYGGYGIFGGKDFYVLVAEMNGLAVKGEDEEETRKKGISLAFSGQDCKFPNLVECPERWKYTPEAPEHHRGQGLWEDDRDY